MERRIAHLDMDAFYAGVELQRYPRLRGLPVITITRHSRPSTIRGRYVPLLPRCRRQPSSTD